MSARYSELLEACNKIQLTGKLGILEESSIDEASSIKLQLVLQENINFIKNQITKTPLIENVQTMLAEKWTQAILEDIDFAGMVPYGQEDEGLTAGEMAAIGGAGALGAGALAAARRRPCLVGRQRRRLLHRPARARCQPRNDAFLRAAAGACVAVARRRHQPRRACSSTPNGIAAFHHKRRARERLAEADIDRPAEAGCPASW